MAVKLEHPLQKSVILLTFLVIHAVKLRVVNAASSLKNPSNVVASDISHFAKGPMSSRFVIPASSLEELLAKCTWVAGVYKKILSPANQACTVPSDAILIDDVDTFPGISGAWWICLIYSRLPANCLNASLISGPDFNVADSCFVVKYIPRYIFFMPFKLSVNVFTVPPTPGKIWSNVYLEDDFTFFISYVDPYLTFSHQSSTSTATGSPLMYISTVPIFPKSPFGKICPST